jgi:hypothetical protein
VRVAFRWSGGVKERGRRAASEDDRRLGDCRKAERKPIISSANKLLGDCELEVVVKHYPLPAKLFATLAVALFVGPAPSFACSPSPSVLTELPKQVAKAGYFVEARVIRGYDIQARTAEILLVDKIFVGEGMPRQIVLFRDDAFFENKARGIRDTCSVDFQTAEDKPRLFVLFRAEPDAGNPGEERWIVDPFYPVVTDGEGRERLFAEAARSGRLRGRPTN